MIDQAGAIDDSNTDGLPAALIATASHASCPACGYALRGATSDRCPECGLRVRLVPALRPGAVFAYVGPLLGLGASVVIVGVLLTTHLLDVAQLLDAPGRAAMVARGLMPPSALPRWSTLFVETGVLCVLIALLATVIALRRDVARLPAFGRAMVGVVGGLLPLLLMVILRIVA